jgi:hypothetical protein
MLEVRKTAATRPPATRAAISNGKHMLPGIDGRSAAARRYRDLVADLADDLGGIASLSAADLALVRQAAACTMQAEQLQAAIVNGKPVDSNLLVRVSNTLARTMAALQRKSRKTAGRSIKDYLAARATSPEAAPPASPAVRSGKRI